MADAEGRAEGAEGAAAVLARSRSTLRTSVVRPVGSVATRLLEPLDRAASPAAAAFNRSLGQYFGTVTGLQLLVLITTVLALFAAPLWAPYIVGNYLYTLAIACVWAIFAMAWDVQSGYTGYISFGHSALSGAAGYATALLVVNVGPNLPLWVTIPVSVLAALVVGLVVGLPALRLQGPYFSLITFVAVLLFYRLTIGFSEFLGGETGFQEVQAFTYDPTLRFYYMLVPMLLVAVGLTFVARSNVGMVFVAIRENESAVAAAGLNPTAFKLWSFVMSAIPMGIGGVLLAHFSGNVTPSSFVVVNNSIEMIAMAVLGGIGSVLAPIGGAFLFVILRDEVLHGVGHSLRYFTLWMVVLAVLVFARDGVIRRLWHAIGAIGGDSE